MDTKTITPRDVIESLLPKDHIKILKSAENHDMFYPAYLQKNTQINVPNIVKIIKSLERKGLMTKVTVPCKPDNVSHYYRLTDTGRKLVQLIKTNNRR